MPRALQRRGALELLLTDVWVRPKPWSGLGTQAVVGRFHDGLAQNSVVASNVGAIRFELSARMRRRSGWPLIMARNGWFQEFVLSQLKQNVRNRNGHSVTIFAYSYAADRIFNFAKQQGWRTVLGQIDPGPAAEELLRRVNQDNSTNVETRPAPASYWDRWQTECELADRIVVNSEWSRDGLINHCVDANKIRIIPLAFEHSADSVSFKRNYPSQFTRDRPLRVLFLGQVSLRKGAAALFEAIRLLRNEPIEFWFVGPVQIRVPDELKGASQIGWIGRVPRLRVADFYRRADVFLFPTLSDGFGLTQLEAQSWKLPVIASRFCGAVVQDTINGLVLSEISGRKIADALIGLLRSPEQLQKMSSQSGVREEFSLASLASRLINL